MSLLSPKFLITRSLSGFAISALSILVACGSGSSQDNAKSPTNADILMQIGDSMLTRGMVTAQIPPGLNASDSLRMFDAIAEAWVERNMLVNIAGSQIPDLEKIDRMVEQYRAQLLANEYRRVMANDKAGQIHPDSVKAFYKAHPDMFILSSPAIKGIYVKVATDAPQIESMRQWMSRASSDDIDELERYGLKGAMEYDYFGDTWVSWDALAERIPYRFSDPDQFIKSTRIFEWEDNGTTYLLRILESIPSGEKMPFSFAEAEIQEQLMELNRENFDRNLLLNLFSNGINENSIKVGAYTPIKYRSPDHISK